MKNTPIHEYFGDLTDPRVDRTKKHPLINVLFIALCAVIWALSQEYYDLLDLNCQTSQGR